MVTDHLLVRDDQIQHRLFRCLHHRLEQRIDGAPGDEPQLVVPPYASGHSVRNPGTMAAGFPIDPAKKRSPEKWEPVVPVRAGVTAGATARLEMTEASP